MEIKCVGEDCPICDMIKTEQLKKESTNKVEIKNVCGTCELPPIHCECYEGNSKTGEVILVIGVTLIIVIILINLK